MDGPKEDTMLVAQLRQRIDELGTDNRQLEKMLRDSLGERHQLQCKMTELNALLDEIAELPEYAPELGDYASSLTMVPAEGYEAKTYIDADDRQAILDKREQT